MGDVMGLFPGWRGREFDFPYRSTPRRLGGSARLGDRRGAVVFREDRLDAQAADAGRVGVEDDQAMAARFDTIARLCQAPEQVEHQAARRLGLGLRHGHAARRRPGRRAGRRRRPRRRRPAGG